MGVKCVKRERGFDSVLRYRSALRSGQVLRSFGSRTEYALQFTQDRTLSVGLSLSKG